MIEVPQEQLQTIFALAQEATNMARGVHLQSMGAAPDSTAAEGVDALLPTSPLAAEIFKTLVRCHVANKSKRLAEEASALFRKGDEPMVQANIYPGSPASYGGGRI